MKQRTTVYIDSVTLEKFDFYKQSNKENKTTFSNLVEELLNKHLNNPFNWENENLYNFAFRKENI